MDFSSANVPISRETWAPRPSDREDAPASASPANRGSEYAIPPADAAPYRPPQRSYESRSPARAPYEDRARPPPEMGPRQDAPSGYGGGYQSNYRSNEYSAPPKPRHAPAQVTPNNVLGVFGLSIRSRERDLEDEFSRYGDVEKVVIVYDQRSDRSRGFGFITMRSIDDAERARDKLNGVVLNGRPIRVDFSATQKPHNPTPGQYMGERKPLNDDRYASRGGGGYDRRDDDRRSYGGDRDRDRYDDRDRERSSRYEEPPRRRDDDRYERKRSASPGHRRSRQSPVYDDRRPLPADDRRPPPGDYDAAVPAGDAAPRY